MNCNDVAFEVGDRSSVSLVIGFSPIYCVILVGLGFRFRIIGTVKALHRCPETLAYYIHFLCMV